jgi:hypothetical protein
VKRYIFPLLFLASLTWAGNGDPGYPETVASSGYKPDIQSAAFRSGLSGADTLTTAGILATTEFKAIGRPTLVISARFSSSGANCKIRLAYIYKSGDPSGSATATASNKIKGFSQEITLTAGTTQYEATYYPAPDQLFDSEGSVTVRVLVTGATSAGTVDLWVGSF